MKLTNEGTELVPVNLPDFTDNEWWQHHNYLYMPDENSTMFGTDIPLTRIYPFNDLRDEITASLKAQSRFASPNWL
jgi:hypothetical protein